MQDWLFKPRFGLVESALMCGAALALFEGAWLVFVAITAANGLLALAFDRGEPA